MLHLVLQYACTILNQHLKSTFALQEDRVILNRMIASDGSMPPGNQNKVVLTLINLLQDTTARAISVRQQPNYATAHTENYNVDVLISANFDDYSESLKFLDAAILFFQTNALVDAGTPANLPQGITRLGFFRENIS